MRNRTASLLLAVLIGLGLLTTPTAASAAPPRPAPRAAVPDVTTWKADVATVMAGAKDYLSDRVATAEPGERLAINLDIDNTSLATYYERGRPVRKVRNLARWADQLGIAVLFNTGRLKKNLRGVDQQLAKVGYDVTALCTREQGEKLAAGKQRCRRSFVDDGYTLVLNIGNNPTDFRGSDYEKAYRLPNYGGALG